MLRKTPLKASTPLVRRARLAAVGRKRSEAADQVGQWVRPALSTRVRPAASAQLREALVARSGGVCEMSLPGCTRVATDVSHRVGRKMGGRHRSGVAAVDRLSAVLHACRTCHQWCHSNPGLAYEDGLLLREGQDPTREPVLYRGVLSFLTDDGAITDFFAHHGEEAAA